MGDYNIGLRCVGTRTCLVFNTVLLVGAWATLAVEPPRCQPTRASNRPTAGSSMSSSALTASRATLWRTTPVVTLCAGYGAAAQIQERAVWTAAVALAYNCCFFCVWRVVPLSKAGPHITHTSHHAG